MAAKFETELLVESHAGKHQWIKAAERDRKSKGVVNSDEQPVAYLGCVEIRISVFRKRVV